jgi:type I restriction enzyme M protein
MGEPFEKKYVQFSDADVQKVTSTYHRWQTSTSHSKTQYEDVPEFCHSASFDEIAKKDFLLVPSKYIEFVNRDENIDFDEKMTTLKKEMAELLQAEEESKKDLLKEFKEFEYEIK